MKADQERVKTLLTDTVSLLCKNGLQFSKELKVQGLLGITLDNDDVFVVHINEIFESLLGAQLAGVRAEEHQTSAIAAADSATSDASLRSKKETLSKAYDSTRTPAGGKRKISRQTPSHQVAKVKKEINEEELVILDAKSIDSDEFETEDGSGDGDREAMRKSYGESLRRRGLTPVKQQNKPDSVSESFSGNPTDLSAIVDVLDNEEESRLSGAGYDDSAGCSAWEPSAINQTNTTDLQSQDSIFTSPVVLSLMQQGLLQAPPGGGDAPKLPLSSGTPGNQMLVIAPQQARQHQTHRPPVHDLSEKNISRVHDLSKKHLTIVPRLSEVHHTFGSSPSRKYRPKSAPNKPWMCGFPGCGLSFYEKRTMTRHMRFKHSEEFTDNSNVGMHSEDVNSNITQHSSTVLQSLNTETNNPEHFQSGNISWALDSGNTETMKSCDLEIVRSANTF